jgi:hypothetical protein
VRFDFCKFVPDQLGSYRGYYEDLALDYQTGATVHVADLLPQLRDALGRSFEGYKGGEFVMHRGTNVWVAPYGESWGTAITGVRDTGYYAVLETAYVG